MTGDKSVIELLVEEMAVILERIAALEQELERLANILAPDLAAEIRAVLGPKQ